MKPGRGGPPEGADESPMKDDIVRALKQRGVGVEDIAQIVYELQRPYLPLLTFQMCRESVEAVLNKREAQHAILTGLALDQLAEEGLLPSPLQEIIARDEPLYGVDEILALAITNIYGSVGLTSFGYLDKRKLGIIGRLNRHAGGRVNTFLDDLIAGIAAAASARLAHQAGGAGQEDPAQQAAE